MGVRAHISGNSQSITFEVFNDDDEMEILDIGVFALPMTEGEIMEAAKEMSALNESHGQGGAH